MSTDVRLPESFLRGLEADLRALCADSRRKTPRVKEAAERVILLLKQADSPDLLIQAADNAADAFCAACEPPPPSANSTAFSAHVKVVLCAVSSLHKLITHRALSPQRLPQVLDALQRLAEHCVDDSITLKVLQGLLSLLTVRSYAKSLSEDDLARAFSLLFILKTARAPSANNPASNALSAISQMSAPPDFGVIEQTSKAAFRQVSSDLFASAADSAVQTAVRTQTPSGEIIPLEDFPTEARASYRFFIDLCNAMMSKPLQWLTYQKTASQSSHADLDLTLALEVIDDGLSSNIALFAAQPVFSDLLSKQLCPVIHSLLQMALNKQAAKSLFALIVTVLRHYWRILNHDALALLTSVVEISSQAQTEFNHSSWPVVFSFEALRCIFRSQPAESSIIVDFVRTFEQAESPQSSITNVINVIFSAVRSPKDLGALLLPPAAITGIMKPFAKTISNSSDFIVAAAAGLYIDIVHAMEEGIQKKIPDVSKVLLDVAATESIVVFLGRLIELSPFASAKSVRRHGDDDPVDPVDILASALKSVAIAAHSCNLEIIFDKTFATICEVCSVVIHNNVTDVEASPDVALRISTLYLVLYDIISRCQETLGRSWSTAVDAFEVLDQLFHRIELAGDKKSASLSSVVATLKPKMEQVFSATRDMKWTACHDMISALVQSSRHSMLSVSKGTTSEDVSKNEDLTLRVFGISSAEKAILHAFQRASNAEDPMPSTLWELLTGHLTSVCADSPASSLRLFALNSLTRIACSAIPTSETPVVPHEKVITPFLDLFNSTHVDVRHGSLSSLYTILETQGEGLRGEAAWRAILTILKTAAGSKAHAKVNDSSSTSQEYAIRGNGQRNSTGSAQGSDMISEGFKVVQVIADDFLSSLARSSLPAWLEVVGLYCRQEDEMNVALTSIGLLWRTADFLAKSSDTSEEEGHWVDVFRILKDVSVDDRPEIRNCAVKTLTGALTAHSFRLSARAWSGCVEEALLPLLEGVMKGGMNQSQADDSSATRSRSDSQVMWHHSRDTPRKQWNETRVLALSGVATVLRSAMPRLAVLQDEGGRPLFLLLTDGGPDGLWRKMLRAAGVAAASRDQEVAIAGASALLELLTAAGFVVGDRAEGTHKDSVFESSVSAPASLGGKSVNRSASVGWIAGVMGGGEEMTSGETVEKQENQTQDDSSATTREGSVLLWEAVWSALTEAISGKEIDMSATNDVEGSTDTRIVDEKALQMLSESLIESRQKLASKFTTKSSKMLVEVLMYLAAGNGSIDPEDRVQGEGLLTQVQEVTLKGLRGMSFGTDSESWVGLMEGLLKVLPEGRRKDQRNALFTRRILEIVRALYSGEEMPENVKSGQLRAVLPVLGSIMLRRGEVDKTLGGSLGRLAIPKTGVDGDLEKDERALWRLACDVLVETMGHGQGRMESGTRLDEEWRLFAGIVDKFLFAEKGMRTEVGQDGSGRGERTDWEAYDVRVAMCVAEGLASMRGETETETKEVLVGILARGAEEGSSMGRRRFGRTCQRRLFALADGGTNDMDGVIEKECGRQVEAMCGRVLKRFIADGMRGGRCPLPAARRAEAVFVLRELGKMLWGRKGKEDDGGGGTEASRKRVLALYPRLCECVESRDEAVRALARELLDEASPMVGGAGQVGLNSGVVADGTADIVRLGTTAL